MNINEHPIAFLFRDWEDAHTRAMLEVAAAESRPKRYIEIDLSDPTGTKRAFKAAAEEMMSKYDLCLGEVVRVADEYFKYSRKKMLQLLGANVSTPDDALTALAIPSDPDLRPARSSNVLGTERLKLSLPDALMGCWDGYRREPLKFNPGYLYHEDLIENMRIFGWCLFPYLKNCILRFLGLSWQKISMTFEGDILTLTSKQRSEQYRFDVLYVSEKRPRIAIQPEGKAAFDIVFEKSRSSLKAYNKETGATVIFGSIPDA